VAMLWNLCDNMPNSLSTAKEAIKDCTSVVQSWDFIKGD
jgi:hypothetical protein